MSSIIEYYNEQLEIIKTNYNKGNNVLSSNLEKNNTIIQKLSDDIDSISPSNNADLRNEIIEMRRLSAMIEDRRRNRNVNRFRLHRQDING